MGVPAVGTGNFNVNETHTFSSNLVNEFGANLTRIHGEIYCAHCEIPPVTITGGMSGFGVGGPTPFIQNNYFYRDVVTWIAGAHTVKGGMQFSALQSDWKPTAGYQRPTFNFTNVWDFALDNPFSEGNIGFNPVDGSVYTPDVAERQKVIALFVEDSWRVWLNLMLQDGLRWETYGKVGQDTLGNNVEWLVLGRRLLQPDRRWQECDNQEYPARGRSEEFRAARERRLRPDRDRDDVHSRRCGSVLRRHSVALERRRALHPADLRADDGVVTDGAAAAALHLRGVRD